MLWAVVSGLALQAAAPAATPDYTALCAGWAGRWRTDVALTHRTGSWTTDNDDPDFRVEPVSPGRCRFYDGKNALEFEIDTTNGGYDATYDRPGGRVTEHGRFVFAAIQGPRDWAVTVDNPVRPESGRMIRYEMSIMGDVMMVRFLAAPAATGAYQPIGFAVNRRQP